MTKAFWKNPQAWFAGAALLLLAGTTLALATVGRPGTSAAQGSAARALSAIGSGSDIPVDDSDGDGVSDALENYVYGTDANDWDTSGTGIPDGWLVQYGFDPTDPTLPQRTAAAPAADSLPDTYAKVWPDRFGISLRDAYRYGAPDDWDETRDGPWRSGLDPTDPDQNGDGIPDGFLVAFGVDPRVELDPSRPHRSDDAVPLRQKYEEALDPTRLDTDGDGLDDARELASDTSDPRLFSTGGSGIGDGWAQVWGFDPADGNLHRVMAPSGLSLGELYAASFTRVGPAVLTSRIGLDPTKVSTLGGPIPDGWLLHHGLDPLDPSVPEQVYARASDWPDVRDLNGGPQGVPGLPDLLLTHVLAYRHGRPATWNEDNDGPWNGGLDPRTNDTDADGLPDAVELRGWYVTTRIGVGQDARDAVRADASDPLLSDSDLDGLSDVDEYAGRTLVGTETYAFPFTSPARSDTDFDGLLDADEVLGPRVGNTRLQISSTGPDGTRLLLDPTRTDSAGRLLADGDALTYWSERAKRYHDEADLAPYEYPHSALRTLGQAAPKLGPHALALTGADIVGLYAPQGDADADGTPNLLDVDSDNDQLPDGAEIRPAHYRFVSGVDANHSRSATDPANPDTDGDGLADAWEVTNARFDTLRRAWLLDPSREKTLNDGVPDGQRDPDGDSLAWVAFRASGDRFTSVPQRYAHTHLQEQEHETSPFEADTSGDTLPDGFGAFWGKEYPDLLVAQSSLPGDLRPDPQLVLSLNAQADPHDAIAARTLLGSLDVFAFRRVVDISCFDDGGSVEQVRARAQASLRHDLDEEILDVFPRTTSTEPLCDDGRTRRTLALTSGTYRHNLSQSFRFATNPYLEDSDGDGQPDAWEAAWLDLHQESPEAGLDPARFDPLAAPGGTGLTARLAYQTFLANPLRTLDPLVADSDHGGIDDSTELQHGLDPLDPRDDERIFSGTQDTDADGLQDFQEAKVMRTSPLSVDTDRDGLLDGQDMVVAPGDVRLQAYRRAGVAHTIRSDGKFVFYGELGHDGQPTKADPRNVGIPEGWLVYYFSHPNPAGVNLGKLLQRYQHGRPAAWLESIHGVWWWGLPPTAPDTLRDADGDGLDDLNGEDPVAAADHNNSRRFQPGASGDPLAAAQAFGDCPGNPLRCRAGHAGLDYDADGLANGDEREGAVLVDVETDETVLEKGVSTFTITGRLVRNVPPQQGIPNVPVFASLREATTRRLVGATVTTGPTGAFQIEACVCPSGTVAPGPPGVVVLGRDEGLAEWGHDLATLPLGSTMLHVFTYNTTATFFGEGNALEDAGHAQRYTWPGSQRNAFAGASTSVANLRVTAGTTIAPSFDVSQPLVAGTQHTVRFTVSDSAGQRVGAQGGLSLEWPPGTPPVPLALDPNGAVEATIGVPTSIPPGPTWIGLSYAGSGDLLSSSALVPVTVVGRTRTFANVSQALLLQGQHVDITGRVSTESATAQGVVVATLGSQSVSAPLRGGSFAARLAVPTDVVGDGTIVVSFQPGASPFSPSSTNITVTVRESLRLVASTNPGTWLRGEEGSVEGFVTDSAGRARAGVAVLASLLGKDVRSRTNVTASDGSFRVPLLLPGDVQPGHGRLVVQALGAGGAALAVAETNVTILARSRLLDLQVGQRTDGIVDVRGRVETEEGQAASGAIVRAFLPGGIPLGESEAGSGGAFTLGLGPLLPSGNQTIRLDVLANPDLSVSSHSQLLRLQVRRPLIVGVDDACLTRGEAVVSGRVREPLSGRAPLVPVHLELLGETLLVQTDAEGRFQARFLVRGATAPGVHTVLVTVPETPSTLAARVAATFCVFAQSQLSWVGPSVVPRGGTLEGRIVLLDNATPLPGRTVHVSGFDGSLLRLETSRQGAAVRLDVPTDLPGGSWPLRVRFDGDNHTSAATLDVPLDVRDGTQLLIVRAPKDAKQGSVVDVVLRLTDSLGRPLAGERVGVASVGAAPIVFVTTDDRGEAVVPVVAGANGLTFRYAGSSTWAPASVEWAPREPLAAASVVAAVLALLAAVLLAGGVVAAYRLGRWRSRLPAAAAMAARGRAARDLNESAVLLGYRRFVDACTARGLGPAPHETLRAHAMRVQEALALSAPHVGLLVRLAERALYGDLPITKAQRRNATAATTSLEHAIVAFGRPRPSFEEVLA